MPLKCPSKITDWLLCFLSAGLLILAFPRTDLWIFAWFGLVPLMFALDGKKPSAAFRTAFLCGFLFFLGTLFWFFNIVRWFSYIAALGVSLFLLYLSLYFGLFGIFYSLFFDRKPLVKLILLPSAWAALEFIRAYLFTGFDWGSLGQSQYRNLPFIQIADVTGVFGISFLVVMVNVLFKEFATSFFIRKDSKERKDLPVIVGITFITVILVLGYGLYRLSSAEHSAPNGSKVSIAVVQPNISQEMKWDQSARMLIVAKQIALSKQAARKTPDIIIWPETSCPDYLWEENRIFRQILAFVQRIHIPVLLGSVVKEGENYYNASIFLSEKAEVIDIYRKVHLVPFGEFIPFRSFIPFISNVLDIGDFTRGTERTVFAVPFEKEKSRTFSVLICFEDTVARLSRSFVNNGAQLLVNITNDAWFGNTKAPFMHLQSAVFRTVENRRALVRAANTGVSCFIDPWGRIVKYVVNQEGGQTEQTYISGYALSDVELSKEVTFYTKFGDVFAFLCFGCILMGIIGKKRKTRIKNCLVNKICG